jgi:AcrR family transcriptional regulator
MPEESLSKGERTRQAILDAAYSLFLEQGFAATSMRQIAGRAGLALGGIYNHFESKEAIFSELIIDRHPYQQILPILLSTPSDDPESFIRTAGRTIVNEIDRRPDFIRLMLIEIVEFNGRNMPKTLDAILPQILPLLEKFDKKSIRPIPAVTFFRAFLGMFFSFYITELLFSGTTTTTPSPGAFDDFVEIFLHGIMADKETA